MGVLAAGYGVMFTMLDDWRSEYGIQETGLSMIIAVGFFTSFAAQLTIAPLADKGHARKLLSLGMLANAVGAVLMAFGESLPAFLLGRFVMGLGAGIAIPAIKRIVIVSDRENIGRNLGRGVSIEVAGFAIGPVISALTVDAFNLAAPFIIITVLTMILESSFLDSTSQKPRSKIKPTNDSHLTFLSYDPFLVRFWLVLLCT